MSHRARSRALAALLAAGACACGYSTGLRPPEGIAGVGVEVFGNDSFQRNLELEMHSALIDSMDRMVHAPVVSPQRADLVIRGRIVDYARRGGIRSPQNVLLETGVRIVVEVQLVRRGLPPTDPTPQAPEPTPSARGDRDSMPETAPDERVERTLRVAQDFGYLLSEPLGESRARERTLRNLADRIVLDLFGDLRATPDP